MGRPKKYDLPFICEDTMGKMKQVFKENINIAVAISGGSDSDVLVHLFETSKFRRKKHTVRYYFFNTGLEFQATKGHISYLENHYNITIYREKPELVMAQVHRRFGTPYKSKDYSEFLSRLQKHNFKFQIDGPKSYDELVKLYPKCKSALNWWCQLSNRPRISNREKRKIIKHGMPFTVTNSCCKYVKKDVAKLVTQREKTIRCWVIGIRLSEGGVRELMYRNKGCYNITKDNTMKYLPLLHWTDQDKAQYVKEFGIVHSKCYTEYGMHRTGCSGCPFGKYFEEEIKIIDTFEPKLSKAVHKLFDKSYDFMNTHVDKVGNTTYGTQRYNRSETTTTTP